MSEDLIYLRGTPKELRPVITALMAQYQLLANKDIGTIYADCSDTPPVRRRGKPQICLYFQQDTDFKPIGTQSTRPHGRRRRDGVISFRLMNETPQTFTEANQTAIAQRIKQVFGANDGYVWQKGKELYNYTDWDMGYQLELLCRSNVEAKRVITSVLSVQNHTPNWLKLTHSEPDQADAKYPIVPAPIIVGGKQVQPIEHRPRVDVRFRHSYAVIEGLIDPVHLYDRKNKLAKALVI